MSLAAEYLEAAKLDQLVEEFRQAGYDVRLNEGEGETRYDLVAEQGTRRIAVEVVARSKAQADAVAERVSALREQAYKQGFNEFRLVLVSPPHETAVEIGGLEALLSNALINDIPSELDILSSHTRVLYISDVNITSTTINREGIQVAGTGIVLVELEYGGGEERDGLNEEIDFPFSFDLILTLELELEQLVSLRVDTTSFYR